jgi:hypothetical protein
MTKENFKIQARLYGKQNASLFGTLHLSHTIETREEKAYRLKMDRAQKWAERYRIFANA